MEHVRKTLSGHEQELMALPNVVAVGIGEKDGRNVIKVFVTRKVSASELQPHETIPKQLEGCELDVEEIGSPMAQSE